MQNRRPGRAEQVGKDIRRATRWHFSAEDKIRIVLDGLRDEDSIAELCRKEDIAHGLYCTWSKELMEAGKCRLTGDTARAATTDEVKNLRREASALKECVAGLTLENRLLKNASSRIGATTHEVFCTSKARDHPMCESACNIDPASGESASKLDPLNDYDSRSRRGGTVSGLGVSPFGPSRCHRHGASRGFSDGSLGDATDPLVDLGFDPDGALWTQ